MTSERELCFWHPVGAHAGESLDQIVARKRDEIVQYGDTLWSFAAATVGRVEAWRRELRGRRLARCVVLCCGDTTVDPYDGVAPVRWMTESSEDARTWMHIPPHMTSYHRAPGSNGIAASGFVVEKIEAPTGRRVTRPTRWLRANETRWDDSHVPTRGEYLVDAPAETTTGRAVRLVLTTREPFVVWLR